MQRDVSDISQLSYEVAAVREALTERFASSAVLLECEERALCSFITSLEQRMSKVEHTFLNKLSAVPSAVPECVPGCSRADDMIVPFSRQTSIATASPAMGSEASSVVWKRRSETDTTFCVEPETELTEHTKNPDAHHVPDADASSISSDIPVDLKRELEFSGLHGVSSLINSRTRLHRAIWLCLISFLFVMALLHTGVTIHNAMQTPTHFKISYKPTKRLQFPDFTLCSHHGMYMNLTTLEQNLVLQRQKGILSPTGGSPLSKSRVPYQAGQRLSQASITTDKLISIDLEEFLALLITIPDFDFFRASILEHSNFQLDDLNLAAGLDRVLPKFSGDPVAALRYAFANYNIPCTKIFARCYYDEQAFDCCGTGFMQPMFNVYYGLCYVSSMERLEMNLTAVAKMIAAGDQQVREAGNKTGKAKSSRKQTQAHFLWVELAEWYTRPERDISLSENAFKVRVDVSGLSGGLGFQLGREQYFDILQAIMPASRNEFYFDYSHVIDMALPTGPGNSAKCLSNPEESLDLFSEYSPHRCSAEKWLLKVDSKFSQKCIWPLFRLVNQHYAADRDLPWCFVPNMTQLAWARTVFEEAKNTLKQSETRNCILSCERREFALSNRQEARGYEGPNIIIRLHFANPSFTILEEELNLQWTDYVSLVGGLWGLWLGSSIITIIHLVGILAYFVTQWCKRISREVFQFKSNRTTNG